MIEKTFFKGDDAAEKKEQKTEKRTELKELKEKLAYSSQEVAKLCSVSLPVVYGWIHRESNPLPAIFLNGRKIVVPLRALESWLEAEARREVG